MIVLRFTQSLLKDMKIIPTEDGEIDPLWSWHVNIYRLNNRKHIVFVNDLTRLCLIVDGVRSSQLNTLKEKFITNLRAYLLSKE